MKLLKKLMICSLAVIMSVGVVACSDTKAKADSSTKQEATKEEKDVVIAKVNGTEIFQSDLDKAYNNIVAQYKQMYGESPEMLTYLESQKPSLVDSLISRELLLQKAKELKIEVTDEEVKAAYDELVKTYGEEQVKTILAASNYTEESYKAELKNEQILTKVEAEMQKGNINVTDDAMKKYYNDNIASFTKGAGANMQHLLVKVADTDTEEYKKKCEEAVKTIEKEIAAGSTYDQLKAKYTAEGMDKNMYIVEDLGFVEYEQANFDPLFLEGAKKVKEGGLSGAVKSSFGYHFIQVNGIKDKEVTPFEEAKASIKQSLEAEQKEALYQSKLDEWTKAAKIEKFDIKPSETTQPAGANQATPTTPTTPSK